MNVEAGVRGNELFIGNVQRIWNRVTVVPSLTAIVLYLLLRYTFHQTGSISSLPRWLAVVADLKSLK